MAKAHVLNINEEDYEFALIGLSLIKDHYEAVVAINEALLIHLELGNTFPLSLSTKKVFRFSMFNYTDSDIGLEYLFIPNASNFNEPNINVPSNNNLFSGLEVEERSLLVRELPKTDYFLILKGEEIEQHKHKVIQKLKSIKDLLSVQLIDVSELPSRNHLVF